MTNPGIPRLSDVARHVIAPTAIKSTGWPQVRDTCRRLGWEFDGWQDGAGRLILGKRSDGLYAADTIVISIPRQVGKTYLIACIIFALCLISPGLTVIWTAHRKTTAAETFESFAGMSKRPRVAPHIGQVMHGKGDEKILFRNGSRILFGARESGFGRGFSDVDVLVFDEAQIMTETTLEDMAAAQNVAKNPLTFMMGTPPRPKDSGEVFTMMRQEALDGESDETLYIELSGDRNGDPMDREQWRIANPSFPARTSERAMLRLRKKLKSLDSWCREALGIWDAQAVHQQAITSAVWRDRFDVAVDGVRPDALGVDMSHRGEISISACWIDAEDPDLAHAEEVWAGPDAAAAVEWITGRATRRMPVVIDNASPAAALAPELKARRLNVVLTTAGDMSRACGLVVNKARAGTLTHGGQDAVTEALQGARKRPIRDAGGWGWDRRDETANVAPLVAWTLAVFGATTTRRRSGNARTRQKAVIG
jgi:hypothetical protein